MNAKDYAYKIVLVGDAGVGKTSMVQRFITGKFFPLKKTVGADISTLSFNLENNDRIRLQIWDFAGEERFRNFLPSYIRGAAGCIMCYDITRESSFTNLHEWHGIIVDNTEDPLLVLVGCKYDIAHLYRSVKSKQAESMREVLNIPYFFETSSKSGLNNTEIFKELANAIYNHKVLNNIPL